MHGEYNETGPTPQTTALTRMVDKARTPAKEFLRAVGTVLTQGDYQLGAYGVDSENQWSERESASIKLDQNTTLTVTLTKSK